MKYSELRQKSELELKKLLEDNREKLRLLRFNLASSKIKNIREIRTLKRSIAKIFTILKIKK